MANWDWKSLVKKLAPMLGTALGGPVGLGAATILQSILGTADSEESTLSEAMAKATPDQLLVIKNAENDFKIKMTELGFKNESELEKIAADDRASARNMAIARPNDYTPAIGFYLITAGFFGMLIYILKFPIPDANKAVVFTMLGTLGTAWVACVSYFYGTNRGSQQKTEMLYNSTSNDSK